MSAEELPHLMTPGPDPGPARPDASGSPRQLTPVTVTRDGSRLLLVDQDGNEFVIAVDDSLRTAVPTPQAAADQSRRSEKTSMSTPTLRPRDIQARIRSGESPESVADAAGTSVEKIMPFAAPVIAEREHTAERALKASVRRRPGEPAGTARTLGEAVAGHLRAIDVDTESVEWDSWRRSDGRWSLVALYSTPARSGTAELTFDPPGNFVSLDNDDARWLVGDVIVPEVQVEPVRDDLAQARERRLTPVTVQEPVEDALPMDEPLEAFLPEAPVAPAGPAAPEQVDEAPAAEAEREPEAAPAPEPPARRTPAKKRGRASVPSWDEIMFGGGTAD
ncbi:septation protein SepH [Nocardioides sp. CER19]|uniref:septation protein SepH n=1 Tax=Nocardioides sp. CER19 TaxID=3038538 RepID=UPI00244D4403|nr:septation protein SepH [Nocardioides sp. CER19]MDH2416580.1 septation protein SepH [Nocardioides sp. CER19]